MACIIFALIKASEISLGIHVTPPFLALYKEGRWGSFAGERGGGGWCRVVGEKKNIPEKRGKIPGAEARRVGMSAGNLVGSLIRVWCFQRRKGGRWRHRIHWAPTGVHGPTCEGAASIILTWQVRKLRLQSLETCSRSYSKYGGRQASVLCWGHPAHLPQAPPVLQPLLRGTLLESLIRLFSQIPCLCPAAPEGLDPSREGPVGCCLCNASCPLHSCALSFPSPHQEHHSGLSKWWEISRAILPHPQHRRGPSWGRLLSAPQPQGWSWSCHITECQAARNSSQHPA